VELNRETDRPLLMVALPEEAKPLLRQLSRKGHRRLDAGPRGPFGREVRFERLRVLTTGMGPQNARAAFSAAVAAERFNWVVTAGIAGGLDPALCVGDGCFDVDPEFPRTAQLASLGLTPGICALVSRVAVTSAEKARLRAETGARLVDMESAAIRQLARAAGIPSATVRTVSDTADEDLPLNFGDLVDANQQLLTSKLAWAILRSPGKIPALMRLQRSIGMATGRLATVLAELV
jgi:adenosylhomocysteine nucleosidase